ncbi:MAG: hypothetical protein CM1200mP16_05400 [Nitrospina sp.]|nr:MAG: hypothetical protein CM1200mP16_05400 [Nitrospina sp.]
MEQASPKEESSSANNAAPFNEVELNRSIERSREIFCYLGSIKRVTGSMNWKPM